MPQSPAAHRCYHRGPRPYPVIDENGAHFVCAMCAVVLLPWGERHGTISLVISQKVPADA